MGSKILNQFYRSCNVTWEMPCKNTSFLKLWPREALTTHDHSMACSTLFLENISICYSYTSPNLDSDFPLSAALPQAWDEVAGGDSSSSGDVWQSTVNPAGHSISNQLFGQLFLPYTHLHGTMWVLSMDSFSPGVTWHLLFVPLASRVACFEGG